MIPRDIQAVIRASNYVRHGTTGSRGGSFRDCTCPKAPCGGVADSAERGDCPEHRQNRAQAWHWDAECPGRVPADLWRTVRHGLAVFPLPPGGKVPEPGWQQMVTRELSCLPTLFGNGANVGIACRDSGVVGLDLDVHQADGIEALESLFAAQGQEWPRTLTVRTPSGGMHLYFRVPETHVVLSSSNGSVLGPGIDVRGPGRRSGGYLLGPGSVIGGRFYTLVEDVPVAPLPECLLRHLGV